MDENSSKDDIDFLDVALLIYDEVENMQKQLNNSICEIKSDQQRQLKKIEHVFYEIKSEQQRQNNIIKSIEQKTLLNIQATTEKAIRKKKKFRYSRNIAINSFILSVIFFLLCGWFSEIRIEFGMLSGLFFVLAIIMVSYIESKFHSYKLEVIAPYDDK